MSEPDRYSNEWYRTQFSGITHLQRLLASNQEDDEKRLKEMSDMLQLLESRSVEDAATIAALRARIDELETWRAKMVEWLKKKEGKA